jgi:hypothetical protein
VKPGRVLLIDRENSPNEIAKRLELLGVEADTDENLKVLCGRVAPPLTDEEGWKTYPIEEYDLLIVDSFGAFAEGGAEADAGAAGSAMAILLDICRRGPVVLVLTNTWRNARAIRGSGVIIDRADIVYEVRDATDLVFDPATEQWWESLRTGSDTDWSERAKTRQERNRYRLALVPTKFRVGPEPEPWALELRLGDEPEIVDVTIELRSGLEKAKGQSAADRKAMLAAAARKLRQEVRKRCKQNAPIGKTQAEQVLCTDTGISRVEARRLLHDEDGKSWSIVPGGKTGGRRGEVLVPPPPPLPRRTAETEAAAEPLDSTVSDAQLSADAVGQGQQKLTTLQPSPRNGSESADSATRQPGDFEVIE